MKATLSSLFFAVITLCVGWDYMCVHVWDHARSCDPMWHYKTPCNIMWHHVTSCEPTWPCDLMWHHVSPCDMWPCDIMWAHVTWPHVTSCESMWPCDMWPRDMWPYVTSCEPMWPHVTAHPRCMMMGTRYSWWWRWWREVNCWTASWNKNSSQKKKQLVSYMFW